MADLNTHGFIENIRGRYGKMVVRNRYGKQYLAKPPNPALIVDTPARAGVRERFTEAAAYAEAALADSTLRPIYLEVGKADQIGPFAAAVRDYLRPPVVGKIDLSAYKGQPGDPITVTATDDVQVTTVTLTLRAADGTVIETGPVTKVMGKWTYVATTTLPAGQPVTIEAVAKDRPNHEGRKAVAFTR
jgi:hypothetical protein